MTTLGEAYAKDIENRVREINTDLGGDFVKYRLDDGIHRLEVNIAGGVHSYNDSIPTNSLVWLAGVLAGMALQRWAG